MRIGLLMIIVAIFSYARENPFKAPQKENLAEASMGEINKVEPLQTVTIAPPIDSVKINRIVVEYQNIDGKRTKKIYDIEKPLDPLKSIKVSQ